MMLLKKLFMILVAKVYNIYTNDFDLKTKYRTEKAELEKEIPDVNNLLKNETYWIRKQNSKCSNLATTNALTAVENKIPSSSVKKNRLWHKN